MLRIISLSAPRCWTTSASPKRRLPGFQAGERDGLVGRGSRERLKGAGPRAPARPAATPREAPPPALRPVRALARPAGAAPRPAARSLTLGAPDPTRAPRAWLRTP